MGVIQVATITDRASTAAVIRPPLGSAAGRQTGSLPGVPLSYEDAAQGSAGIRNAAPPVDAVAPMRRPLPLPAPVDSFDDLPTMDTSRRRPATPPPSKSGNGVSTAELGLDAASPRRGSPQLAAMVVTTILSMTFVAAALCMYLLAR